MDIFYWREKLASFWFSSSSIPQQRFSCFPFSSFVYSLFFFLVVIYNFNYVCSSESFYKRQFRENCSVSMISLRWNPKWLKLIYINLVQKMTSNCRFSYYLYPICWWKFILKRETKLNDDLNVQVRLNEFKFYERHMKWSAIRDTS